MKSGKLTHFPNLDKTSQAISDIDAFYPGQCSAHLDKVVTELGWRFGELDITENIAAIVSNPFLTIDIGAVAAKFQQLFALLENDIGLKPRSHRTVTFGDFSAEISFLSSPPVH